jgi:hypothetical protein
MKDVAIRSLLVPCSDTAKVCSASQEGSSGRLTSRGKTTKERSIARAASKHLRVLRKESSKFNPEHTNVTCMPYGSTAKSPQSLCYSSRHPVRLQSIASISPVHGHWVHIQEGR